MVREVSLLSRGRRLNCVDRELRFDNRAVLVLVGVMVFVSNGIKNGTLRLIRKLGPQQFLSQHLPATSRYLECQICAPNNFTRPMGGQEMLVVLLHKSDSAPLLLHTLAVNQRAATGSTWICL